MKLFSMLMAATLASAVEAANGGAPEPLFRDGERLVFQGDSITDGARGRGADPNHILGHGYVFVIAARHGGAYPGRGLTFINRGVGGNQVGDLVKRWQADTIDQRPTTLSVLIGINDVLLTFRKNRPVDVAAYERDYDAILASARAATPDLRIVLLEPFFLPGKQTDPTLDDWTRTVGELRGVVARLGMKFDALVVPLQADFDAAAKRAPIDYWIWDGIHPTYAGHQLIADAWERAYVQRFGPPPATTRPAFVPPSSAR